jgi:hypothetical protein
MDTESSKQKQKSKKRTVSKQKQKKRSKAKMKSTIKAKMVAFSPIKALPIPLPSIRPLLTQKSTTGNFAGRKPPTPAVPPAQAAVLKARDGFRARLRNEDVKAGTLAWLPFATVIDVTRRDHCKGSAHKGVEVVYDRCAILKALKKRLKKEQVEAQSERSGPRPAQKFWNQPCLIIGRENEKVWILPMASFKGKSLDEKIQKYPEHTRKVIASGVIGLSSFGSHPLRRAGDQRYRPLNLVNGAGMNGAKNTYVKLDAVVKLDWRDLQIWPDRRTGADPQQSRMLDEESTARLLGLVKSVCGGAWDGARRVLPVEVRTGDGGKRKVKTEKVEGGVAKKSKK